MQKEISKNIQELQNKLKLRLYEHGTQAKISEKTGISPYLIRTTVNSKYPNLEILEKIEKALKQVA